MAKFVLELGSKVDLLTKEEVSEALAEDAAIRAAITGVKTVDQFWNLGGIGAPGSNNFATPVNMVASGLVWAVLNIGFELSAAAVVRVYKGTATWATPGTPIGAGRLVGTAASLITPSVQFAKGQCMLRGGDQLSFVVPGAPLLLSAFLTATEIPAERVGELLL